MKKIPRSELLALAEGLSDAEQHAGAELIWKSVLQDYGFDPAVAFSVATAIEAHHTDGYRMREAACYYEQVILSTISTMELKGAALQNIAVLAHRAGRSDKASIGFNLALQIDPASDLARRNLASALEQTNQFEAADAEYEALVRQNEDDAGAHFSRGMIALLLGDFARGWAEYEWRFKAPAFPTEEFKSIYPRWQGENLNGKTILLTQDQGFGDQIMFARYAWELKKQWPGCLVHWLGHTLLLPLMQHARGVDAVFDTMNPDGVPNASGGDVEFHFDYHCPLMSLAFHFGTTLETIPRDIPYFVNVPKSNYLTRRAMKQVALVWAGSPRHGRDNRRSIEPELFQPLVNANMVDCEFHSFQIGPRAQEVERLQHVAQAPECKDWLATAKMLLKMDLVVTVDTAIAHLAGALGIQVFMLCPYSPDWRWMLEREDSPWYPSMKLFRQKEIGNWEEVIARISAEI